MCRAIYIYRSITGPDSTIIGFAHKSGIRILLEHINTGLSVAFKPEKKTNAWDYTYKDASVAQAISYMHLGGGDLQLLIETIEVV